MVPTWLSHSSQASCLTGFLMFVSMPSQLNSNPCVSLPLTKIVDLILRVFSLFFGVFGSLCQNVNKIAPGRGRHASWEIKIISEIATMRIMPFLKYWSLGLLMGITNCGCNFDFLKLYCKGPYRVEQILHEWNPGWMCILTWERSAEDSKTNWPIGNWQSHYPYRPCSRGMVKLFSERILYSYQFSKQGLIYIKKLKLYRRWHHCQTAAVVTRE